MEENLIPFARERDDFCRKNSQFFRKILRFLQENLTIFVERSDGLYKSVHQTKKNIIFNHISMLISHLYGRRYFLIFILKNDENIDYN